MPPESIQPSRDSRHDNRDDGCARRQFVLYVASEVCHGLAGIKVLKTGFMQINANAHNSLRVRLRGSVQINQNTAELAVTAQKDNGPLATPRSRAEITETVGERTGSSKATALLMKKPL